MHAMQFFSENDLSSAQRKRIATLILDYYKQCAQAEVILAEGMITEINNLDSKR
jgi:BioD-like phosphotransacetylase family protein